uniref:Uncharacterized protein n=1 Tax=Tetranychus urticae TaxID=32264 RepID=T1L502_TETUR
MFCSLASLAELWSKSVCMLAWCNSRWIRGLQEVWISGSLEGNIVGLFIEKSNDVIERRVNTLRNLYSAIEFGIDMNALMERSPSLLPDQHISGLSFYHTNYTKLESGSFVASAEE